MQRSQLRLLVSRQQELAELEQAHRAHEQLQAPAWLARSARELAWLLERPPFQQHERAGELKREVERWGQLEIHPLGAPHERRVQSPSSAQLGERAVLRDGVDAPTDARLERSGQMWQLEFAGFAVHLRDSKGLRLLAVLVGSAGAEHHALGLIGLVVGDGTDPALGCPRFENSANGDGPVLGREFEIARLLRHIKRERIQGVVWLTADVHYCAAHYYDPALAQFQDFDPFWEFVTGPLHAGSFGPNTLDNTFGPSVVFESAPPAGQVNLPPSAGLQFFGQVDIDRHSKDLCVALKDIEGRELFTKRLRARSR